jgi:peptidoglycan/xylan/chitin deacetylase (PgdA/CDA1 family)
MMKKRRLSLLLTAVLLITLLAVLRPVSANSPVLTYVITTGTQQSLQPLNSATMPFFVERRLYLPTSFFSVGDRVKAFYQEGQVTFSDAGLRWITFLINEDKVYSADDSTWHVARVIVRDGVIFVPARIVADFYGFQIREFTGNWGIAVVLQMDPITGNAAEYWRRIETSIISEAPDIIADYNSTVAATPRPPTPTPHHPNPPDPSSPTPPSPLTPSPPPTSVKTVYLTFDDGPGDWSHGIMDALDQYNVKAAFFLTGSQITAHACAVRRMTGSGHTLGLRGYSNDDRLFYASQASLQYELEKSNDLLRAVSMTRSRLVRVPSGSNPHFNRSPLLKDTLTGIGFRYWDWNISAAEGRGVQDRANRLLNAVSRQPRTTPAVISIQENEDTVGLLRLILPALIADDITFMPISEAQMPRNFQNDIR